MSKDYSYGESSKEDIQRSPLILILFVFALIGVSWLSFKGVQAGNIYLSLGFFGIAVLFLSFFFLQTTSRRFEIPIATDLYASVVFLLLGLVTPVLLYAVPLLVGAKSIITSKAFVPLAFGGAAGGAGAQSFAVLTAQADPFWKAFIVVFSAGVLEPFVVGFAAVAFGVILGYTIRKLLHMSFGEEGDKWFDFLVAMVFSIALFVVLHRLNDSYVTLGMFVAAGVFRLLMNVAIYFFNLSLAFLIGFHMMNNALAIGIGVTLSGFISNAFGIFLLVFFVIIIISFFIGIKDLPNVFKTLLKQIGL